MATTPQTTSYPSQRVTEGRLLFGLPSSRTQHLDLVCEQSLSAQRDEGKQPEQNWGRARNRPITPLPLRLNSQVSARLFKSHFHPPAPHKPSSYLRRRRLDLGRAESLRRERLERVTHQYPANRDRRMPGLVPKRGFAVDLDLALVAAIPVLDLQLFPFRLGVCQPLLGRRGRRAPLLRGRPFWPGLRSGAKS